jgi:hypothetical protein
VMWCWNILKTQHASCCGGPRSKKTNCVSSIVHNGKRRNHGHWVCLAPGRRIYNCFALPRSPPVAGR